MDNLWPLPGQPFDLDLQGVISAAGTLTLDTEPVSAGEVWVASHVFISDLDGNATTIKLYVGRVGGLQLIDEWVSLTQNVGRVHADAFYVSDGQYIEITFAGGTSTHRVRVHITGTKRGTGGPKVPVVITT